MTDITPPWKAAVSEWVRVKNALLSPTRVLDNHIDEIEKSLRYGFQEPVPAWVLDVSLAMLEQGRDTLLAEPTRQACYLLLIIRLSDGNFRLARQCPQTRDEVVAHLTAEPPSLYLIPPHLYGGAWEYQGYRSPLPFSLLQEDSALQIFYTEGRAEIDRRKKREFSRRIEVRYWIGGE